MYQRKQHKGIAAAKVENIISGVWRRRGGNDVARNQSSVACRSDGWRRRNEEEAAARRSINIIDK